MTSPLALSLLLAAASVGARAQDGSQKGPDRPSGPEAAGPGGSAPRPFYRIGGKAVWVGQAVARKDLVVIPEVGQLHHYCMLAPAADWALDAKDAALEDKVLHLLFLVAATDGALNKVQEGSWTGSCGVRRDAPVSDPKRLDGVWYSECRTNSFVDSAHRYTCEGKTVRPPSFVVVHSLKELLKSPNAATVVKALSAMEQFQSAGTFFAPSVGQVVLDEKADKKVRAAAVKTLAVIAPTALSGQSIASVWMDDTEPEDLRIAAMNAFSFAVQWGDSHGGGVSQGLKDYLPQLVSINKEEIKDKVGGGTAVTPLGSAAHCAAKTYPAAMRKPE